MPKDDGQFVNIRLDDDLIRAVDKFRFANEFPTRTGAIRWLLDAALKAKLKPAAGAVEE